ncbi:MAG: hypothetical protein H6774_03975 [Pseudomonadales bacterium]|nr:hypothetical protein [Pseudomonadales bacterium]
MKKACVFGASITSGMNDFKEGGWCDLLKRYLLGKGIFIFNLGISGDDTNDLLQRFNNECKPRKPEIIIFAIAGNDSQYFTDEKKYRVNLEDTIKNFEELVDMARSYTSHIILVGLTKVDEEKINAVYLRDKKKYYKNETLKKYDEAIAKISSQQNVHFIPTFDVINETDLDDGLHPTSEGHKKIFFRIRDHLDKFNLY